jgi:hypothetical protein
MTSIPLLAHNPYLRYQNKKLPTLSHFDQREIEIRQSYKFEVSLKKDACVEGWSLTGILNNLEVKRS